jgi:hypothetical protein
MAPVTPLESVLAELDALTEPIDEMEVSHRIQALKPKDDPDWKASPEHLAEAVAFEFHERDGSDDAAEYRWFAPMWRGQHEDGSISEWPSLNHITPEMLAYWQERAEKAKNPVLRARYAGLVWEFTRRVADESPDVSMARLRVDAVVEVARDGRHEKPTVVWRQLEHALHVAISINDSSRVEAVRDTIISYENAVGDDDKLGLWGRAFDLLYDNKKAKLTDKQREGLIQGLEDRLARVSDADGDGALDPWAAEAAALRLANQYKKLGQQEDVRRVLLLVGQAFGHIAQDAAPTLAQAWQEQVERLYRNFGLKEEASALRKKIAELGPATEEGLKEIRSEVTISKEEMGGFVDAMLEGGWIRPSFGLWGTSFPGETRLRNSSRSFPQRPPSPSLFLRN